MPVHRDLARVIDHTLLEPDATADAFLKLADEAVRYGFAAVCVPPSRIALVRRRVESQRAAVRIAAVIGFPHGDTTSRMKAYEAREAVELGAVELDMVVPVGALKEGDRDTVLTHIDAVVEAATGSTLVKVILETGLLTDDGKRLGCTLAERAGADFVKTSTGFARGSADRGSPATGATVADVALLRETVGDRLGVKAAGGIDSLAKLQAMLAAGASRIGCSRSVRILREAGITA